MQNDFQKYVSDGSSELKNEIYRYLSFWPYLLVLIIISLVSAYLYLRYTAYEFKTNTVIEIMDPAQNSEMALPTELTVFNRSMINLENEVNIISSYALNSEVVEKLNANVNYYSEGRFRFIQNSPDNWYNQYKLDFKIETDNVKNKINYIIATEDDKLEIKSFDENDDFISSFKFSSFSTLNEEHNLPFDLTIYNNTTPTVERKLSIQPVNSAVNKFRNNLTIDVLGLESDQLSLTLTHENPKIAQNYLNELVNSFDEDGIRDRQLEYRRTIDFVDRREKLIKDDLSLVELRKQKYKQENNLSDITLDANNNIGLKYSYNSEVFELESQKQIAEYLIDLLKEKDYDYLPINIGIENLNINNLIEKFNEIVAERYRYINQAGSNSYMVKSLEPQMDNVIQNITSSLNNFKGSLDLKISNLKLKENEFDEEYNRVPENEKILRSIERELSIKEALYLLLLQKREEASINFAVVKPTIKVIDYSITDYYNKDPNPRNTYFAFILAPIILYFVALYIWFFVDNKVHSKEQLSKLVNFNIPIIGEIPFINDVDNIKIDSKSRSIISESIRMLLSNLKFSNLNLDNTQNTQTIIFTSSIKGEGKTLASVNTALGLANDLNKDKRVILLGTDLRNPQVHRNFNVEKSHIGISEIIYNSDYKNYMKYIYKFENLDILFSGAIPPNPTAMLSSDIFKKLILSLKNEYDYIIIDSAPCLLVSDTFQYIDLADSIVYLFRANFTDSKIVDFINEIYENKQIKNLNLVLNAVGNSAKYGYKYGYQYGYRYGYKYAYNYGYGYGYSSDEKK